MIPKQEQKLRKNIRQLIEVVKQRRESTAVKILAEESKLRGIVRGLLDIELSRIVEGITPDNDPTPNKSTGINVLEDLLKKIIPVLQTDFKLLTTDDTQRQSFRAHIINAVIGALTPAEVNNEAGENTDTLSADTLSEVVDVDLGGPGDSDKFIDIRTDAEKSADEDEPEEEDPRDDFGMDGADETGRNVAFNAFKKIQTSIIDSYELLSNNEDQELFYDYLIANLKLYFDKFEDELAPEVEEPTNQAYQDAVDTSEEEVVAGGEDIMGGEEDELDLEF
tara:strand:+ start:2450 stop:3286 length:837 start_codon:yes stop_codon:yes gene_type:complete